MDSAGRQPNNHQETREQLIGKRLDAIGWALFFIMIGGIGLVPTESVPKGTWLVGVGVIMLGVNAARYLYGIKMIGLTLVLGAVALGLGLSSVLGIKLPVFPILLILVGGHIIFRTFFSKSTTDR